MAFASIFVVFLGAAIAAPVETTYPSSAGRQNDLNDLVLQSFPTETASSATSCEWLNSEAQVTPTSGVNPWDDASLESKDGKAEKRQISNVDLFDGFIDDLASLIDAAMSEAATAEPTATETTLSADDTTATTASVASSTAVDNGLDISEFVSNGKQKRQAELLQPVTGLLLSGLKEKRQAELLQPVTGLLLSGLKEKRQLDILTGLLGGLTGLAGGGLGGPAAPPPAIEPVLETSTLTDTATSTTAAATTSSVPTSLSDPSDLNLNQRRGTEDKVGNVVAKLEQASQDLNEDQKDQLSSKAMEAYCSRYGPQCCWLNKEDTESCSWEF
ncbi:hypothetical protein DER45DRAFT_540106 [Fusarium avenaceum]|nr:hypothetical protein DER45DRAFT_540106 [Fusarium avenaceum]